MNNAVAANVLGIFGAVLWSLQLLPQIWKNWRRHNSEFLSPTFLMLWAIAGVPLGTYNIVEDFNIALQIQPNILIFLSLLTWSQCKHYAYGWTYTKIITSIILLAATMGGVEASLVVSLRVARNRGQDWPSTFMAVLAAVLLASGVLRHFIDVFKSQSDAGISLRFAALDASGDLASLLSVAFQSRIDILGLVIYGTELSIWLCLIVVVVFFRMISTKRPTLEHANN